MSDFLPENEFSQDELANEMREVSNEFRDWLANGFESDMRKQALRRLSAKREGAIVDKQAREQFQRTFQDGADPREIEAINGRLNQLYAKPNLSKAEDAERKALTDKLQSLLKRYPNGSSKNPREW